MAEVREGFLCPICMSDLGDEFQLQVHFEEKHSKEDPIFLQNIKDLFGKAKKKILNNDEMNEDFSSLLQDTLRLNQNLDQKFLNTHPVSGVHLDSTSRPKIVLKSHDEIFRIDRKRKNERNKTTNQLLTRLEKLMKNYPTDSNSSPSSKNSNFENAAKRRAHEQSVVPWIDEENVNLCPMCAKSFNIARRKHHCRLCGSVLCKDCLTVIDFEFAQRVINPASISSLTSDEKEKSDNNAEELKESGSQLSGLKSKLLKKTKIFGSHESLNSLIASKMDLNKDSEDGFKSCGLCREILEKQEERVNESSLENHQLVKLNEKLQLVMKEGREMGSKFRQMTESLNNGEEEFNLGSAQMLQIQILKTVERIETLSKDIAVLDPGYPECQLQLHLQQQIRRNAMHFVKESLIGLPRVPTEIEFEKLKKMRKERAHLKVEEEKQAAKLARLRYEQEQIRKRQRMPNQVVDSSPVFSKRPGNNVRRHNDGLVLSTSNIRSTSDDPMVQQIHNIQQFIKEAKTLGKFEEVSVLEENLRELQQEYQKNQVELEENYNSFKNLFHKVSPLEESNQFQVQEEQEYVDIDDYDSSGKNPFFDD